VRVVRLAIAGIGIAIVVSLLSIIIYPSAQDFMKANSFWNGIKDFTEQNDVITMYSLENDLPDSENGVLIAIPYKPYEPEELDIIKEFVADGGLLLVLDDYGYGNQILEALESNITFDGSPLLDPYQCYRNQWLPVVNDFASELEEIGLEQLNLNYATAINAPPGNRVLARSSETSYLDHNENGDWDEDELRGPFAVIVTTGYGKGTLVAVSDPSILINSMMGKGDNNRLLEYLISLAGEEATVAIDETHIPAVPLDWTKNQWEKILVQLESPYRKALVAGVVLIITTMPLWKKGE